MFDLNEAVSKWRKEMLGAGVKSPVPLNELESHLREQLEGRGVIDEKIFDCAVRQLGRPGSIRSEFKKVERQSMKRKIIIGLAVFGFFVGTSIILPALAQHNKRNAGTWATDEIVPVSIGCLVALVGVGTIGYTLKTRRNAPFA